MSAVLIACLVISAFMLFRFLFKHGKNPTYVINGLNAVKATLLIELVKYHEEDMGKEDALKYMSCAVNHIYRDHNIQSHELYKHNEKLVLGLIGTIPDIFPDAVWPVCCAAMLNNDIKVARSDPCGMSDYDMLKFLEQLGLSSDLSGSPSVPTFFKAVQAYTGIRI